MTEQISKAVYYHEFTVPDSALDENGHVNNVVYVQWMQDVATLHFEACGGESSMIKNGATWFARSHHIEYLTPAFAGEGITAVTWVTNYRRVRTLRRYRFLRKSDGAILARGETDWVFVDAESGKPRSIPDEITQLLPLLEGDEPV